MFRKTVLLLISIFLPYLSYSQSDFIFTDSLYTDNIELDSIYDLSEIKKDNIYLINDNSSLEIKNKDHTPLVISSALLLYGSFSFFDNSLMRDADYNVREFRNNNFLNFRNRIDNYVQYLPAITTIAMQFMGVKGHNNWSNSLLNYAIGMAFVGVTTNIVLKNTTKRLRPDASAFNSFNSGHTAVAFASAEFLRREYGERYPYLAYSAYVLASGVGVFRILNNRHWLSDVVKKLKILFNIILFIFVIIIIYLI